MTGNKVNIIERLIGNHEIIWLHMENVKKEEIKQV